MSAPIATIPPVAGWDEAFGRAPAHTEGPWRLDDPQHAAVLSERFHIIDAGPGYFTGTRGFSIGGIMSPADARLIKAAPELLEVARLVKAARTAPNEWDLGVFETACDAADAVIASVTGGA